VRRLARAGLATLALWGGAAASFAEPIFLARQYARCTGCHYSPTGGGLLTPYGRSLSREELSTFGKSPAGAPAGHEQEFAYGALRGVTGPVSLGFDVWPAHLEIESGGFKTTRDFLMSTDLSAALRHGSFTFYGELGRQPRGDDKRIASFEHWISYQPEHGLGLRVGRFIPAYGIKLADHTAFTRSTLELDNNQQLYALELSWNGERQLVQVSLGPGLADDIGDSTKRAFTATGRWQYDLRPNLTLVASGLYRDSSELEPRRSAFGLAAGVAPIRRLTLFVQGDARFRDDPAGGATAYTLLGEAALEVYRGVWIELSPQLLTAYGDGSGGVSRFSAGLNFFPRTHFNLQLFYYHDRTRGTDLTAKTVIAQLHLYL